MPNKQVKEPPYQFVESTSSPMEFLGWIIGGICALPFFILPVNLLESAQFAVGIFLGLAMIVAGRLGRIREEIVNLRRDLFVFRNDLDK